MSESYQERFLDEEDGNLYRALDLSDRVGAELNIKDSTMRVYLDEMRAAYIEAMQVLEGCKPNDIDNITKAQADMRAYRRVREWISGVMVDGDRADMLTDEQGPLDSDSEIEEEGFIPIPQD